MTTTETTGRVASDAINVTGAADGELGSSDTRHLRLRDRHGRAGLTAFERRLDHSFDLIHSARPRMARGFLAAACGLRAPLRECLVARRDELFGRAREAHVLRVIPEAG